METTPPEKPSAAPVERKHATTASEVRAEVQRFRENRALATQANLDALKADVAALPEKERNKLSQEAKELLAQLREGADLEANLIKLEEKMQGISERAGATAGGVVGRGVDVAVGEVSRTVRDAPAAARELWRTGKSSTAAAILSTLGLVGFATAIIKTTKSKSSWKSKLLKYTGLVLLAGVILRFAGGNAEAREAKEAERGRIDSTTAAAFRTAMGGNRPSLFGTDALSNDLVQKQINLVKLGTPVGVGAGSIQFERAAAGDEVLWVVGGKKFRVKQKGIAGTPLMRSDFSGNLSGVSRVPNSNLVKFHLKDGNEFHMDRAVFEAMVSTLSSAPQQSSQSLQVIPDSAKPQNTQTMTLEFEQVTAAPAQPASGTAPVPAA